MNEKHPLSTRILHWLSALLVLALFFSGWYMVDLHYYSPWYQTLPELHFLAGTILIFLWSWVLIRLFTSNKTKFTEPLNTIERISARLVKCLFYLLVSIMVVTGYLIATSSGETLVLFDVIKLPAVSHFSADQIDTMGSIHKYSSYLLMMMVVLHVIGALKHHFIDKDDTLKRMI